MASATGLVSTHVLAAVEPKMARTAPVQAAVGAAHAGPASPTTLARQLELQTGPPPELTVANMLSWRCVHEAQTRYKLNSMSSPPIIASKGCAMPCHTCT